MHRDNSISSPRRAFRSRACMERGGLWANLFKSTARHIASSPASGGRGSVGRPGVGDAPCRACVLARGPRRARIPDRDAWQAPSDRAFDTVEAGAWWGTESHRSPVAAVTCRAARPLPRATATNGGSRVPSTRSAVLASRRTCSPPRCPTARMSPTGSTSRSRTRRPGTAAAASSSWARGRARHAHDAEPHVRVRRLPGGPRRVARSPCGAHRVGRAVLRLIVHRSRARVRRDGRRHGTHQLAPKAGPCRVRAGRVGAGRARSGSTRCRRTTGCSTLESGRPARHVARRRSSLQLAESCLLAPVPRDRRRHVLTAIAVRALVRGRSALGFLRPPWGLAYDGLFNDSWDPTT